MFLPETYVRQVFSLFVHFLYLCLGIQLIYIVSMFNTFKQYLDWVNPLLPDDGDSTSSTSYSTTKNFVMFKK